MQKISFPPDTFVRKERINERLQLFELLLEIRHTEEIIAKNYKDQEMRTAIHLGTGQEATAVGVCANLKKGDTVFSHHRSHNQFLASGGLVFDLLAELYGREAGCSRGRGGSVHLNHHNEVTFASTAILGECVSLAVGSGLSFKMRDSQQVAVAFFGDAVWEEGVMYESLNFAAIHSVPVLFVCENNLYSTESSLKSRKSPNSNFTSRALAFGVESYNCDGNSLIEAFSLSANVISKMRIHQRPYLIEFSTYRWREHVGPNFDFEVNRTYRSKLELEAWQRNDPLINMRTLLMEKDGLSQDELTDLETRVIKRISQEILLVKNAPKPNEESLFENSGEL